MTKERTEKTKERTEKDKERAESQKSEIVKVLIMGLDNSGKTSIIYTLEQNFASFYSLKPTVSFQIREDFKILGLPVKIWDLGGQKQYRDEYLSVKKGFILGETNLIFFVIDAQDAKRYNESIDYLERSLEFLTKLGLPPPVVILLLHKIDPDIRNSKKVRDNIKILQNLITSSYYTSNRALKVEYFETSIYDREELSRVFVAGLFKVLPKTKVIQESLNDFMKNSEADAVILLDENVLILGEAFTDNVKHNICSICGPYFANMIEKLIKFTVEPPKVFEAQMADGWLFHILLEIQGKMAKNRFYLVFFSRERTLDNINKQLPRFTQDLSNLIKFVI